MNTLQIGLLYGGATIAALFSGIPIAFALGSVHAGFHAGGLGRYHYPECL